MAQVGHDTWTLQLNKYQRDNLLWLINVIGWPYPNARGVPGLNFLNTGDWIGEIGWMLAKSGPVQEPVIDKEDRPNITFEEIERRARWWAEQLLAAKEKEDA